MKRIKKFVLAMVAVFALSAAPQSASAKVHRVFYAVDQDFYMQFAYDDVSGVFAIRLMPLERDANAGLITITSPFGSRTAPKAGASTNHMGLDMRASYEKVLATEDNGRVL